MITFRINEYINILHQMSKTDLLASHANNVLGFLATKEMLASSEIETVSYGQASIRQLPGLEEYKVRLGYFKKPMRYVVRLHPLVKSIILGKLSNKVLAALKRQFPEQDILKQITGIVDIALQSQGAKLGSRGRSKGQGTFILKQTPKSAKGKLLELGPR
jgi:hypothetical protein